MPDQNLPKTNESSTAGFPPTAPAPQADGPRESAPEAHEPDRMQSTPSPSPLPAPHHPDPEEAPQRLPYWLQQAEKFLRIVVRMYIGLGVCCVPWIPPVWDANPLFSSSPGLSAFVATGAVKGLVSGLGLLNLWIALRDAIRSSDSR